jgi:hypothetical protein
MTVQLMYVQNIAAMYILDEECELIYFFPPVSFGILNYK